MAAVAMEVEAREAVTVEAGTEAAPEEVTVEVDLEVGRVAGQAAV